MLLRFARHEPADPSEGLPAKARFAASATVFLAVGMANLDLGIANVALPTIAQSLHTSASASVWIITIYQLATIAVLLPLSTLGDVIGHRTVFTGGLILFTLASLACGLAPNLDILVIARFLQGLGGAGIMTMNAVMLRFIYPPNKLGQGMGANALSVGLALAAGPTVASVILSFTTWHWLFLINVFIGIYAWQIALRHLPPTPRNNHKVNRSDAVLCMAALSLLGFGLNELAHYASWQRVAIELAGALICLVALIRRERGKPAPLLPIDLLKIPVLALSSLTAISAFTAQGLAFVALPFLLQTAYDFSQVDTGFLITPWPVLVAVMAMWAGRLSDRFSPSVLGCVGVIALGVGLALLAALPAHPSVWTICWRMAICGFGFGLFQSPNLRLIMSAAPMHRGGGANGIIAMSRLIGQSGGAAVVAACFHISTTTGAVLSLWIAAAMCLFGCVPSLTRLWMMRKKTSVAA